jgi:hypothetical protein
MVVSKVGIRELQLAGFHLKTPPTLTDKLLACSTCRLPEHTTTTQLHAAPKKYDGQNGVPLYDASHGGHYGASAAIATAGHAPPPETFSGHWGNVSTHLRAHAFTHHLIY